MLNLDPNTNKTLKILQSDGHYLTLSWVFAPEDVMLCWFMPHGSRR